MITLRRLTKKYRLGIWHTITPVNGLDLEVRKGEFAVITGRSGTGKSTLLNLAAGLIKPTSGEVFIDGVPLSGLSDREISRFRSRKTGFIFQFPSLLPALTVLENVALPAGFARNGRREALARAAMLLERLGLAGRGYVYPAQLSAGEQKRAVVARSLVNNPEIILADEPTSDLDEETEREVMNMLREINAGGVTLLMVTHSLQLIPYADRAFKMRDGALLPV